MAGAPRDFYFCFPYRGAGGVSLLFLRLGSFLAENLGQKVTLIDYADGFMTTNLRSSKVSVLEYRDDEVIKIPDSAILVMQSNNPWSVFPGVQGSPDTTLIFWNCFPFNLVPVLPGFREYLFRKPKCLELVLSTILRQRRQINSILVEKMHAAKSIFFMDAENLRVTEKFLRTNLREPQFLPIPTMDSDHKDVAPKGWDKDTDIHAIWIGRIADFKFHILWRVLKDAEKWCRTSKKSIVFTIVGDGPFLDQLKSSCETLKGVQVKFLSELSASELSQLLENEKQDLAFCMGTSALECARIGIPTILLDATYGPVSSNYRYRWLFQETGFNLGRILSDGESYPEGCAFDDVISQVQISTTGVSEKTRKYFDDHHSLSSVANEFVALSYNSSFRWKQFVEATVAKRDYAYLIFSKLRNMTRRLS